MKNFKIKLISKEIPFEECTKEWQQLVDIQIAVNNDGETSLLELCGFHNISPNYYKDLSKLVEHNLIRIEE